MTEATRRGQTMRITVALLALLLTTEARAFVAGGTDTAPDWNFAVATVCAAGGGKIEFGPGVYHFHTRPNPIPCDGVTVTGTGPWTTTLRRRYSSPAIEPFIELHGRGSTIQHITIETAAGTMGGYGLHVLTNNTLPAGGKHHIRHVRIAGEDHKGTWRVALHMQGDQRTVAPIGLRGVKLYDVELFDSTLWLAVFWGAIVCDWYGGGAYQGGGTINGIAIGGLNSQKNRIDADIDWASSSVVGTMRGPGK